MRRREVYPPLIGPLRHTFVVPVPPASEPELSARQTSNSAVRKRSA